MKRFLEKLRHRNYCWLVRKYGWAYVNFALRVAPLNGAIILVGSAMGFSILLTQDIRLNTWIEIGLLCASVLIGATAGIMMIYWGQWNPDDYE